MLISMRFLRVYSGVFVAGAAMVLSSCGQQEPEISGGEPDMRRITDEQYSNTISDIFGSHIALGGRTDPIVRVEGLLALGTRTARITPSGFEQYYILARSVATQVVDEDNQDNLIPCRPASPMAADETCAREFFTKVGRLLYRRPLTPEEIQISVDSAQEVTDQSGDFYAGIALGLARMLTSPQFLFITDTTEPDPERQGELRLTSYAKASRLSFLLWNTTPDSALLTAAENGELETKDGLERQVDRMLASHRIEDSVRSFFEDFLHFDQFETLEKDSVIYPVFSYAVATDAKEQVLRTLVDHLIERGGDYRDIFTTRKTFITGALARVYQVPVKRPSGGAWLPYEFAPDDPRGGILTQVGFIALSSHPGSSSPTLRGKAIRESFLCQKVPDPPGDVDFALFENPDGSLKTMRERLTAHRTMPACAGCHKITDPIGLALEHFDGVGQFRTTENEVLIDASGDLDGIPFDDAMGLGRAMRENPATTSCLVNRMASYGFGRPLTAGDREFTTYLEQSFADDGYRIPDLLKRIALSEALYTISAPETERSVTLPTSASTQVLTETNS